MYVCCVYGLPSSSDPITITGLCHHFGPNSQGGHEEGMHHCACCTHCASTMKHPPVHHVASNVRHEGERGIVVCLLVAGLLAHKARLSGPEWRTTRACEDAHTIGYVQYHTRVRLTVLASGRHSGAVWPVHAAPLYSCAYGSTQPCTSIPSDSCAAPHPVAVAPKSDHCHCMVSCVCLCVISSYAVFAGPVWGRLCCV